MAHSLEIDLNNVADLDIVVHDAHSMLPSSLTESITGINGVISLTAGELSSTTTEARSLPSSGNIVSTSRLSFSDSQDESSEQGPMATLTTSAMQPIGQGCPALTDDGSVQHMDLTRQTASDTSASLQSMVTSDAYFLSTPKDIVISDQVTQKRGNNRSCSIHGSVAWSWYSSGSVLRSFGMTTGGVIATNASNTYSATVMPSPNVMESLAAPQVARLALWSPPQNCLLFCFAVWLWFMS